MALVLAVFNDLLPSVPEDVMPDVSTAPDPVACAVIRSPEGTSEDLAPRHTAHDSLSVWQLDVFGRGANGGNPCPVVLNGEGLSPTQMQALAAHFGQETVFVIRDGNAALRLRFFVPRHEVVMCVHGTVAAVTVLLQTEALAGDRASLSTAAGECEVTWDRSDPPRITVEQQVPQFGPVFGDVSIVEQVVGLPPGAMNSRLPIRPVSVSSPKLIVPVRRPDDVQAARPDLPQLWSLCRRLAATGAYIFAPHPDNAPARVVARQFPVEAGYPEDAATGVAAAGLAAYLASQAQTGRPRWIRVDVEQGDAMGRPSLLHASAMVDAAGVRRTTVTGQALLRGRRDMDVREVAPVERAPKAPVRDGSGSSPDSDSSATALLT